MERNSTTFTKLAQIERLIDLKRETARTKEEVLQFVIEKTESLRVKSQEEDLPFSIDEDLVQIFDTKINEIENMLHEIAA